MSEYRQDRTTGRWVLLAPGRSARPHQQEKAVAAGPPACEPTCPFCPGNEAQLPPVLAEIPGDGPASWWVRVVANKFPAVAAAPIDLDAGAPALPAEATGVPVPGFGAHEVIIEGARHDLEPTTMPASQWRAVVGSYRDRIATLAARPDTATVVLFRNRGKAAGASLVHPHAQLVATTVVPPGVAQARDWARRHHAIHGDCVVCAEIARELALGRRVVAVTGDFVALVPYAAASPCELWLVPRQHAPCFGACDDTVLDGFAALLRDMLQRLSAALGDPPYNFALTSAAAAGDTDDAASTHWSLRLVPVLGAPGGFELATGLPINAADPDEDAERLRAASRHPR